ncbi:hypothetical protein ACF8EA_25270, partial [Pseudomonas sp. YQ_5]|uniref:hypothetical protein n=1 Tax=Pseudomonas sp. YQ_5 TaxID=3367229 RepID=UPI00370CEE0A
FVSTEARILRFPQNLSSVYFEVFTSAFFRKPTTSTTYRLPRSVHRCEEANNTPFEIRVNTLF